MKKSILLVLTDNFDDMMFLTSQVILEESGIDVLICSKESGTAKGQDSSVMTVPLNQVIIEQLEFAGLILIAGSDFTDWGEFIHILKNSLLKNHLIGFSKYHKELMTQLGVSIDFDTSEIVKVDNLIYISNLERLEEFVETYIEVLKTGK